MKPSVDQVAEYLADASNDAISMDTKRGGELVAGAEVENGVGRDSALYKQTLDKFGATDAQIETVSSAMAKKAAEITTAREELQTFISALSL